MRLYSSARAALACGLIVVSFSSGGEARYRFSECKARVQGIYHGNITYNNITKAVFEEEYLWKGEVRGFDHLLYHSDQSAAPFLPITYNGECSDFAYQTRTIKCEACVPMSLTSYSHLMSCSFSCVP